MSIHNVSVRRAVAVAAAEKAGENGGDVPEFEALVAGRWTALVRTAYLLTGDDGQAQDLAQSALAAVYAHWGKVSRAQNVEAYLHRVLVNTHLARMRRRRFREVELDGRTEAGAATTADFESAAAWRVTVNGALATLPPRQRAVLVLRFWSDMTEAQVAAAMGCSVGTVKSQTFKALAKLRLNPTLQRDFTEGQA